MCKHIHRRAFLSGVVGVAAVLALPGCGETEIKPAPVHWDRDSCDLCRMLISDARFAAQIRGGPGDRIYKFDDIGDAVHWLKAQSWQDDPGTRFWVAAMHSTRDKVDWLDARQAFYLPGQVSPMDYGWGAVAEPHPLAVPFAAMVEKAIARGSSYRCDPVELMQADAGQAPAREN